MDRSDIVVANSVNSNSITSAHKFRRGSAGLKMPNSTLPTERFVGGRLGDPVKQNSNDVRPSGITTPDLIRRRRTQVGSCHTPTINSEANRAALFHFTVGRLEHFLRGGDSQGRMKW
ncbi:hypothetical protein NPIL_43311 [Nephila pilipes]|uniref:Uncharacterized protein n=1 Tax=Nephila pilipes TaxID=299642 RepID=A0A8X6P1D1_NEPPI|nr:hypothetical protein NPIL_43311 [Nephila pilipes]